MASSNPLPPSNHKTVLITGINGYIASHIALHLLHLGYSIRGTSRSPSSGTTLLSSPAFLPFSSRYTHFTVPDITSPHAFDLAVQGVHGIMHTASPVDFSLRSVSAFFTPAVQGNLSLLRSARAHAGPQLASFVLTSSTAAVADRWRVSATHAYTEDDWNESGEGIARESEQEGKGPFMPLVAYGASKAKAERALWEFREEMRQEGKASFACAAINPAVVTGPPVVWPVKGPEGLNETLMPLWRIFSGEAREIPSGIGGMSYVDVRDVALLHVWCMEHPAESDGQRYICANGKGTPQAVADVLRREYPDREIVAGEPGRDYVQGTYGFPPGETSMLSTKAWRAMGVERFEVGFEESVLDTVRAFEERWPERILN